MLKRWSLPLALLTVLALPVLAMASEGHPSIPGAELSAVWVIPFVCMLLSIAIMPLALPHIWHHHFGKISVFWGLAFLIPCLVVYGFNVAFYEFLHAILHHAHQHGFGRPLVGRIGLKPAHLPVRFVYFFHPPLGGHGLCRNRPYHFHRRCLPG